MAWFAASVRALAAVYGGMGRERLANEFTKKVGVVREGSSAAKAAALSKRYQTE